MVIEYSDISFDNLNRQLVEDKLARRRVAMKRLAHQVVERNGSRLLYLAEVNKFDLSDLDVRDEIISYAAEIRESRKADFEEYGWTSDDSDVF